MIAKTYKVTAKDGDKVIAQIEHVAKYPDPPDAEYVGGPWNSLREVFDDAIRGDIVKRQSRARKVLEDGGSAEEAKAAADGESTVRFPDVNLTEDQKDLIRDQNPGKTVIFTSIN